MKEWVKWLLLGILSIAFGVYVLGNTVLASLVVTSVVGIMLLVSGGFQVIGGVMAEGFSGKLFGILMGALMGLLGVSFIFNPLQGLISLALLVLILLVVSGFVRIMFAWRMRDTQFFWPMLISGALSVLLAGYIWVNFETAGPQLLGILLGVELLFNGSGLIFMAFFIRALGKELKK